MNNMYAILLAFSGTLFSLLAFYAVYLHSELEAAHKKMASIYDDYLLLVQSEREHLAVITNLQNENKYLNGWSGGGKDPKASYSKLI